LSFRRGACEFARHLSFFLPSGEHLLHAGHFLRR